MVGRGIRHKNRSTEIEGPVIRLAPRHAKIRDEATGEVELDRVRMWSSAGTASCDQPQPIRRAERPRELTQDRSISAGMTVTQLRIAPALRCGRRPESEAQRACERAV